MAKFYGPVGFVFTEETTPGVFTEHAEERIYSGDLLRIRRNTVSADQLNDNLTLHNELSIVSDPFAMSNFGYLRYIRYHGANWKITAVDVQFPRLILTIGGVYNGLTGPEQKQSEQTETP